MPIAAKSKPELDDEQKNKLIKVFDDIDSVINRYSHKKRKIIFRTNLYRERIRPTYIKNPVSYLESGSCYLSNFDPIMLTEINTAYKDLGWHVEYAYGMLILSQKKLDFWWDIHPFQKWFWVVVWSVISLGSLLVLIDKLR